MSNAIVWFRRDLRLQDNPALHHALAQGYTVIPIYIYAPEEEAPWSLGRASRWWLHHSLQSLENSLRTKQAHLYVFKGNSLETLTTLVQTTQVAAVYWNRLYEPALTARDNTIKAALQTMGITVQIFNGTLLHEPWRILNKAGKPYQMFTPFWQQCRRSPYSRLPFKISDTLRSPTQWLVNSLGLNDLKLLSHSHGNKGFIQIWQPGEEGAWQRLRQWCHEALSHYAEQRDFPYMEGVSRLSPHLHFGELSVHQVLGAIEYALYHLRSSVRGTQSYERQLFWREFAHYLLYHYPHTPEQPLRPEFNNFPWRHDYQTILTAWQQGKTGYPLVDAGMRELWKTGWIHNRVRMITASFLTKNCGVPWQEGARWFWDTLVDANLANNTLGWQWIAGCGADSVPYYRIFNPLLQSVKFDPQGEYLRRWLPELAHLSAQQRHRPWLVIPAVNYPTPIIDYVQSRHEALDIYDNIRKWRTK